MAKSKDFTSVFPDGVENSDVYFAVVEALKDASEELPFNSSELVNKVSSKLSVPLAGYMIYRLILNFSRLPNSQIRSRKGRNGGYFLAPPGVENLRALPTEADQINEKTLEKHLWPAVSDWLRFNKSVDRVSSKVANLKNGGVWSNPDVVGLNIIEDLGFNHIEKQVCFLTPKRQVAYLIDHQ